jgi:DNA-binding NarL/FixJ family response regulator
VILADDLIWATRLADLVRGAGAIAVPARSQQGFEALLSEVDRAIVDLTAQAYDGIAAISSAASAGLPVLAIGQHDDREARQGALAAGAGRVLAYRRVFEDGRRQIGDWLSVPGPLESAT